jgi:hypothetical protein
VPSRKVTFSITDKKAFDREALREAIGEYWDEMEVVSGP